MIENVSQSAPALAPLFRSEQQLRILAVLFTQSETELTIRELALRAGVAQATASREVARLAEHGVAVTRTQGRNTLASANWALPWARDLRSLLMQTVGVLGRVGNVLSGVPGVDRAFIFGSWAARYTGEIGPAPRDVDVLVIGDSSLRNIRRALAAVEADLRIEINPVVASRSQWEATDPEPFVAEIRSRPLVEVHLGPR